MVVVVVMVVLVVVVVMVMVMVVVVVMVLVGGGDGVLYGWHVPLAFRHSEPTLTRTPLGPLIEVGRHVSCSLL